MLKRKGLMVLSLVMMLALIIPVVSRNAKADGETFEFTGEDGQTLKYKVLSSTDKTVEVSDGKSAKGAVVIPEKVKDGNGTEYTVVRIGGWAFDEYTIYPGDWSNKNLESITIPGTVKSIGQCAFRYCWALGGITLSEGLEVIENEAFQNCSAAGKIDLPSSVKTIGEKAFYQCYSLEKIVIPDSVTKIERDTFGLTALKEVILSDNLTSIGQYAFYECNALKKIEIPNNVREIGYGAFCYCHSLEEVILSDNLTSISQYAFYECNALKKIVIPSSVTKINDSAFEECSALEEVVLPDKLESIGGLAFKKCKALKKIEIPGNVTGIGNYAFEECSALEEINWPEGLTSISEGVFKKCSSLIRIGIPSSVTEIGNYAFEECSAFEEFVIPDSVTSIGEGAFARCSSLSEFKVADSNTLFTVIDGVLFKRTENGMELMVYPHGRKGKVYTVPEGTISIGKYAFLGGAGELEEVVIPDSVTVIGEKAFNDSKSLRKIEFKSSVIDIGEYAFSSCDNLTEMETAATDIRIGDYAFEKTGFAELTLSTNVTSMGEGAFSECEKLTKLIIKEGVTSIGESAFYACEQLQEVELPDSLTYIGMSAFIWCPSLGPDLTLINDQLVIDQYAFCYCDGVKNVVILAKSIGQCAFYWSDVLEKVVILPGVESVAGNIVEYCNNPTVSLPAYLGIDSLTNGTVIKYYPLKGSDTETQRTIIVQPGKYPVSYKKNELYFIGDDDPVTFTVVPALAENESVADLFETENLAITDNGDGTYTFTMPSSTVVAKAELLVDASADMTISGWKYGEKANAPKLTEGSNPGNGKVTYTYYTDEKCTEETTTADGAASNGAVPALPGKYYVKAFVAQTQYVSCEAIASFTIGKASALALTDVSSTQSFAKTSWNGSAKVTMPGDAGTVVYSVGEAATTGSVTVSGLAIDDTDGTLTATLEGGVAGDTVTIPVTVASDNYEDATFAFVITLVDRNDAGVSIGKDLSKVYGDEDFAIAAKLEDAGEGTGVWTWKSSNEDVAVVDPDGNVMILASGETEITALYVSDTSKGSATVKLTVDAQDITVADVTVDGYYEYDATAQIPEESEITVTLNGLTLVNGTDYTVEVSDNTNAGEAVVTVTGIGNYTGTAKGSFVIEKAPNPIDLEYDVYVLQGGNTEDLTKSIYNAVGTVTFAIDNDTSGGCVLDPKTGVITSGAAIGQCTVIVTVEESENHTGAQETMIVWVTDKETQEITFAETEVSKTYGDGAFTVKVTGAQTKVTYTVTEGTGVVSVTEDGTVTILGAGTAVITATAEETLLYAPDTARITIHVAQADLPYTVPTELTGVYGQKLSGIVLPKDANGTWTWESPEDGTGDAGTHVFLANFTPKDAENYNTVTGIAVSVTIQKADIDPKDVTAPEAVRGRIYDGTEQSLIVAGIAPNGTMLYALVKEGENAPSEDAYSETIPAATEAGTYVVYYRVEGDANHNDIAVKSLTVKIAEPDPVYYTVTFVDKNGTVLSEQTVLEGETVVRPDDPAKEGNSFDGWFTDAQYASTYDFEQAINADTTVYARFASTEYYVVYGEGMGSYALTEGAAVDLVVTVKVKGDEDRSFYHFRGVKLDGVALGDDAYDVREGSTIVTVPGNLLTGLDEGDHYVTVEFDNGSVEAILMVEKEEEPEPEPTPTEEPQPTPEPKEPEVIESPKTGDESLNLWIALAVIAVMGSVAAVIREKKANES